MKVLIYEELGATLSPHVGPTSWHAEGRAMRESLAFCLSAVPGVEVFVGLHPSQPVENLSSHVSSIPIPVDQVEHWLETQAQAFDLFYIIAPETNGLPTSRVETVRHHGGQVMASWGDTIRQTSDKFSSAGLLGELGLATFPLIKGWQKGLENWARRIEEKHSPWVLKPRDGAGCLHTFEISASDNQQVIDSLLILEKEIPGMLSDYILQQRGTGSPHSIACMVDEAQHVTWLPVCQQRLETKPYSPQVEIPGVQIRQFSYQGGSIVDNRALSQSIQPLAQEALGRMLAPLGPIGFDVLWDPSEPEWGGRIVEINPRLTTSWVGYIKALAGDRDRLVGLGRLLLGQASPQERQRFFSTDASWPTLGFDAQGQVSRLTDA